MRVEPGNSLTILKPNQDMGNLQILQDIKRLILSATPVANTMIIVNKTKNVSVIVETLNGLITVNVTNPDDEVFKLDDPIVLSHEGT